MATNLALDDALIEQARRVGKHRTAACSWATRGSGDRHARRPARLALVAPAD